VAASCCAAASTWRHALALAATRNYRRLRRLGVTPRSATDVLIATFCAEEGHELLHNDRDFDLMAKHLGLKGGQT
jgi:predicted nucleic acid-binding protein